MNMTIDIKQIIKIIADQKERVKNEAIEMLKNGNSKKLVKATIEDDFLSVNDISDRSDEFANDVDYDHVCFMRSDALSDILLGLDL